MLSQHHHKAIKSMHLSNVILSILLQTFSLINFRKTKVYNLSVGYLGSRYHNSLINKHNSYFSPIPKSRGPINTAVSGSRHCKRSGIIQARNTHSSLRGAMKWLRTHIRSCQLDTQYNGSVNVILLNLDECSS